MKHTKNLAQAALALTFAASSHAATSILLTGDTTNSDGGFFPGTGDTTRVNATLNDGFAYNPDDPTSALPTQGYSQTPANGFHANKSTGNHTLSYLIAAGPLTTDASSSTFYFDFYGRNANTDRDNNYTISLYNGDYLGGSLVAQLAGQSVPDSAPFHNRTTINLGTGVTFDRIQITQPAAPGDATQFFTVMEVRAASVPEPSSTALLGLGGLALVLRRRR